MESENGNQGPSPAPDFSAAIDQAKDTGDFNFVLNTAKQSYKMMVDFRDAVLRAQYAGRDSTAIAMGLNFLNSMVNQASTQLNVLKQTEKATQDALKSQKDKPPEVV